jgi:hypothetical protein
MSEKKMHITRSALSADPSVQGIHIIAPEATSPVNQLTLTVPTGVAARLHNVTAVRTNTSGLIDSAPITSFRVLCGLSLNEP